jgi:hypothetical protein
MPDLKMSENYDYSDYLMPHGTINGVAVTAFTTPEFRQEFKEKFKLRPESDIFIVTYPKSGTTWMQNILRTMLMTNDPPELASMKLTDRLPWTDLLGDVSFEDLEKWPSPRVFKCHNATPAEMDDLIFKGNRTAKIIYVLRDPRDVAVSLYHHMRKTGLSQFMNEASFDEFQSQYMRDGKVVFYGLWENHVDNWMSKRHEYDILVLKYEDMIEDASREIQKVANFIGLNLIKSKIDDIAEKTSFKRMTKQDDLFHDESGTTSSIMRKGVVGDWENHFKDQDEAERMERIAKDIYQKHNL